MPKAMKDPSESHLAEVIQETEFIGHLSKAAEKLFSLASFLLGAAQKSWRKKHYFQLISEANDLETFLDDYGARYNKTFSFFTELVASIRGFGLAALSLKHLENRYEKYAVEGKPQEHEHFLQDLVKCLTFLNHALATLAEKLLAEGKDLGLKISREKINEANFSDAPTKKNLPRNVDEEDLVNEEQKIAEVASKYANVAELFERLNIQRIEKPKELRKFITHHCNEEKARTYEANVHNLQSKYDTYIKNTTLEKSDERLGRLRGHISVALHLLEAVTYLVHFYERHENDIRSEKTKTQISNLIDKNLVLDQAVNFGMYYASKVLLRGKKLAEVLLPHYTNVQTIQVVIPDGAYLHARPASLIVSIVNHYATPVEMEIKGAKCNASSIMQMMMLAGTHAGVSEIRFTGDEHPLRDIQLLFKHKLGENGLDSLPEELGYLRGV